MLTDLQWSSLQHQQYVTRLKLFYNIVYLSSVLKIPGYFSNTTYLTRRHHLLHFEIPFTQTNHYKFSYSTTPDLSMTGTIYALTL